MSLERPEVRQWLAERGYSDDEVGKILARLDQFDNRINRESLFDDLASGAFDIGPIIREALDEPPQ